MSLHYSYLSLDSLDIPIDYIPLGVKHRLFNSYYYPTELAKCRLQLENILNGKAAPGTFIPRCKLANGVYEEVQCDYKNGECWCVDIETGDEIPRTRSRDFITCPGQGMFPAACSFVSAGRFVVSVSP